MARILLADDEDGVRKIVSILLKRQGHQVTEADDGQSALDKIKEVKDDPAQSIELLVTDLSMPNLSGVDLVKEIRSMSLNIPVVVITGDDDTASIRDAMGPGKIYFVDKLAVTANIADQVAAALAG